MLQALHNAYLALQERTPKTIKVQEEIDIEDVKPLDIAKFMKDNNIPDDARFGSKENGDVCLYYYVVKPNTDKDKLNFNRRNFSTIAHQRLYHILLANGYKKIPYSLDAHKELRDSKIVELTLITKLRPDETTIYDLYMSKDFDKILKHYSLTFVPLA